MKTLPPVFASCDWGSSNFRLRLVQTDSLRTLDERITGKGVLQLHAECPALGGPDRARFFHDYLRRQLSDMPQADDRDRIPTVVSGMASSTIGMQELDYLRMPLDVNGQGLRSHALFSGEAFPVILVSGARSETNIMRGEETQAFGLADTIDIQAHGILLLPGTHSKHLEFKRGSYLDFRTYMTGELFALLSSHSLLKESVRECPLADHFEDAFHTGVTKGADSTLSGELFSIRARDVLGQSTPEENFHYLSGLLLGHELAYLNDFDFPVFLAAPARLSAPYRLALEILLPSERGNCLDPGELDQAVLRAHKAVLESHLR